MGTDRKDWSVGIGQRSCALRMGTDRKEWSVSSGQRLAVNVRGNHQTIIGLLEAPVHRLAV